MKALLGRFTYDPVVGKLYWRDGGWAGKEAGHRTANRYRELNYRGKHYKVHRIIWLIENGKWPSRDLDHIDGNGLNNRISNLREATVIQNQANSKKRIDNSSGHKGVTWDKERGFWYARMRVNGRRVYLGSSTDYDVACSLYKDGMIKFHGEFARTN